jgi:hypothetical protein
MVGALVGAMVGASVGVAAGAQAAKTRDKAIPTSKLNFKVFLNILSLSFYFESGYK